MPLTNEQAAAWGLLIADVMDAYRAGDPHALLRQPLPGSSLANDWVIQGYLVANDTVGLLDPQDWSFYGVLAQRKGAQDYAVILRGTADLQEWLDNVKALPVDYPAPNAGRVEDGFFNIYQSMRYLAASQSTALTGKPDDTPTAAAGIKQAINGNPVMVTGHSLGAALATYLALDLAGGADGQGPNRTTELGLCLFASPRPGNAAFAAVVEANLAGRYVVYNYVRDVVPDVPPSLLGYCALQQVTVLTPDTVQAAITADLACNHHVLCYCAMLDYRYVPNWHALLARDGDNQACIAPLAN